MDPHRKYLNEIATRLAENAWGGDDSSNTDILYNVGAPHVPGLSAVQAGLAQKLVDLVGQFGQFEQTGVSGAQYERANPHLSEGIQCLNCVFYEGGGQCTIVQDQIEPMGVCRFNIVPERATVSPMPKQNAPDAV